MVERDLIEQSEKSAQDLDVFAEACAVFGEQAALTHLQAFCRYLEKTLSWIESARPDHEALREMAHRTAGRAGVLGFPSLGDASASLDEAARHHTGVAAALDRWTKQARLAAEVASNGTLVL